jgi:hypothetical protein
MFFKQQADSKSLCKSRALSRRQAGSPFVQFLADRGIFPAVSSRLLSRCIARHKVEQQRFHERYRRHVEQKVRAKPSVIMAQVLMAPSSCSRISSVIQRRCHAIVRQIIRVMSYYIMRSYRKLFYILHRHF